MSAEVAAWLGQSLLLVCSLPQAIMSYRNGHSIGLSRLMLWCWFFGMVFSVIYFVATLQLPAIINYAFNLFVASVIIWYSYFPRNQS